jgi:hypothetical protein
LGVSKLVLRDGRARIFDIMRARGIFTVFSQIDRDLSIKSATNNVRHHLVFAGREFR